MIPKYAGNLKLCYMNTDSLVYHIKTDDFYAYIDGDVKEMEAVTSCSTHKIDQQEADR